MPVHLSTAILYELKNILFTFFLSIYMQQFFLNMSNKEDIISHIFLVSEMDSWFSSSWNNLLIMAPGHQTQIHEGSSPLSILPANTSAMKISIINF